MIPHFVQKLELSVCKKRKILGLKELEMVIGVTNLAIVYVNIDSPPPGNHCGALVSKF